MAKKPAMMFALVTLAVARDHFSRCGRTFRRDQPQLIPLADLGEDLDRLQNEPSLSVRLLTEAEAAAYGDRETAAVTDEDARLAVAQLRVEVKRLGDENRALTEQVEVLERELAFARAERDRTPTPPVLPTPPA